MEPRRNEEHEEGATERRREREKESRSISVAPSLRHSFFPLFVTFVLFVVKIFF
jgi:hypothetical protein